MKPLVCDFKWMLAKNGVRSRTVIVCALLTALPLFFGTLALWLAIGRMNNLPIDVGQAIGIFLSMAAILVFGFWIARCMAERKTLPRKRRLEALLKELDARR